MQNLVCEMRVTTSKGKPAASSQPWTTTLWQIFVTLITFVWFLAVIKVFLLSNRPASHRLVVNSKSASAARSAAEPAAVHGKYTYNVETETYSAPAKTAAIPHLSEQEQQLHIPRPNDWDIIRDTPRDYVKIVDIKPSVALGGVAAPITPSVLQAASPKHVFKVNPHDADSHQRRPPPPPGDEQHPPIEDHNKPPPPPPEVEHDLDKDKLEQHPTHDNSNALPATELKWPPVAEDGAIPPNEGYDIMPLTGLNVPRFWEAPPTEDLYRTGRKLNDGAETIFLMIASYRDFQCRETITSAFKRADRPDRLFIGAVDQIDEEDIGCLDIDIPCEKDPTQMICKYRSQISVYKMDASFATGPVTARHIGDRMYRGEYFVMQMDAHCLFINHWDTLIINQWKSTGNEKAVLSSYLTDVQGSISPAGDSLRTTRPIMCNSDYEGNMPARYLRHGSQPEEEAIIRTMPMLQPFWAAGFSFSRGHFKVNVPYDGYQPMVFQGEEIAIGIRGFTFGYDFYAPRDSVVFHEYAEKSKRRKTIHMFWENSNAHKGEGQKSLKRATHIVGMAPDLDPSSYDHTEEAKYGIGNVRPLSEFYRLFLINAMERKATQLCPFVRSGKMHRTFQQYLKPDGRGIDYSKLTTFDTAVAMGLKEGQNPQIWDSVPKRQ